MLSINKNVQPSHPVTAPGIFYGINMATQPTNLPVPSKSLRDLKFNAGKIDEFVTSLVNTYVDRFGNAHYTIEGLRWLA